MTTTTAIKRNRTGCWTCRRRGYRCDEGKPVCHTCTRLQIPCEGYKIRLKWDGNERKRTKKTPKVDQERAEQEIKHKETAAALVTSTPAICPARSREDQFLLQHFFYTISPLLSTTDDLTINTYRRLIFPMAITSSTDTLLHAVLSMSAMHLSSKYEKFVLPASFYKGQVLRALVQQITTCKEFDTSILATLIMLCIGEVFEANPESLAAHLNGAGFILSEVMAKHQGNDKLERDTRTLLDIFAYHDVLASISHKRRPLIPQYYTQTWSTNPDKSKAFLASADAILSCVARLSAMVARSLDTGLANSPEAQDARGIASWLQQWKLPDSVPDDMLNTAEAMRHAALLFYAKSMFPRLADEREEDMTEERKLAKQDALTSTQAILNFIGKVKVNSAAVASHSWPVYMAGYFTNVDSEREFIRQRLLNTVKLRGIKSVDRIRERLETIWEKGRQEDDEGVPVILY